MDWVEQAKSVAEDAFNRVAGMFSAPQDRVGKNALDDVPMSILTNPPMSVRDREEAERVANELARITGHPRNRNPGIDI